MTNKQIIVLGANPSWQKTLFFESLTQGKVNRAIQEENYSSGKGVNFCRALRCSKLANSTLFQFAGGINGERLCKGLDAEGFHHTTIKTESETRCCITCLDKAGNMTELIGKSSPLLPEESSAMLTALYTVIDQKPGVLAITGSLPDGSNPDLYFQTAKYASAAGVPVLIDALVTIKEIMTLPGKMILKVNKEEFLKIFPADNIKTAHKNALHQFPDKVFAVTDGGGNATLSYCGKLFNYTLPPVKVVSPLGAGDTASAVMAALYAGGTVPEEAFLQSLAAASANCETDIAGNYSPARAAEISKMITIGTIPLEGSV